MSGCCDGDVITGAQGPAGESAYQVWLDEGNVGTEQDFLDSLKGDTGAVGATGPAGATGATGPTGADGPSGADGDDGASYLTGTGNPSVSLGEDGDTYSNNSNGEIWKKNSGVWTFTGFTLIGPQGPQGPQGLQGNPGLDGADGADGVDGDDGVGYDNTISSTSIDLGVLGTTTSMTWTINKAFIAGSRVRVADSSNPSVNYFEGVVNTYDSFTGNVDLEDILIIVGSGTISSWNVSIAGEQGGASGTPAWSAVLAAGNTSGVNDPIVDASQVLGLNGGTSNKLEYDGYLSGIPHLTGTSGAGITDGVDTSVSVDNTNATVDTPIDGAMVLPSSNNPTADVSVPIEGMIKTRTQVGNKDVEAYINGSWRSLTSGGDTNGIGKWEYVTTTTAPTSAGEIRFDNATIGSATNLYVDDTDNDSVDKGSILNILAANDYFYIQQVDNANNFALVEFSSVTDNTTYVTYGINSITVVGSFSANDKFFIIPISKGGGGGGSNTNIIGDDLTQTAKRQQDLDGNAQEWINGRFVLTDNNIEWNLISLGNTGTSIDVDLHTGNMFVMTATDNFTLTFSNEVCTYFTIKCIQDATGSRVLTGGAEVVWGGGVTKLLSTAGGSVDIINGWCDGTNVYLSIKNDWS